MPGQIRFRKLFPSRLLFAALVLLWPLLRALNGASLGRSLASEKILVPESDVAIGLLIAAVPLLCCGAVSFATARLFPAPCFFLWHKMPEVLFARAWFRPSRNCFFRGFSWRLLRSFSRVSARCLTSRLFAVVPFLKGAGADHA
jgi:hypothetical protein